MKVGFDTNYLSPYVNITKQAAHPSASKKIVRNFDDIMIQSSQEITQEQAFANSVCNRLFMEVKRPPAPDQIESLQLQIEQGTYEIDVNSIADKMMLY